MDDRRLHKDDGPHDHATLMRSLSGIATDSTGISLLMSDLIAQFTGSAEEIAAAQDRYYRFVLERLMDGLESLR